MSAVAARIDPVSTLAALIACHVFSTTNEDKVSFTAAELLEAVKLPYDGYISLMGKALPRVGLEPGFCLTRWERAWFRPLPWPGLPLDDMAARAREAVEQTAASAAARHWAFYREGSLDIVGRLSCAIAIHKLQAANALDIPEARP